MADDCIIWIGAHYNAKGYGRFYDVKIKKHVLAHRRALEQKLGRPIRAGMLSLHLCDNPPCINPAHLYEGSWADNVRDMMARGRHVGGNNGLKELVNRRGTCPHGHRWTQENTYIARTGSKICRPCRNESGRRHRVRASQQ